MRKIFIFFLLLLTCLPVSAYTRQEASDKLAERLLSPDDLISFVQAVMLGKTEVVQLYIDAGQVDVNSKYMASPILIYAAIKKQSETAVLLIKAGADPLIHTSDGGTVMHYAVKNGMTDVVREILKDPDVNLKKERMFDRMPLVFTARHRGYKEMEELLVNHQNKYDENIAEEKAYRKAKIKERKEKQQALKDKEMALKAAQKLEQQKISKPSAEKIKKVNNKTKTKPEEASKQEAIPEPKKNSTQEASPSDNAPYMIEAI